MDQTLMAMWMTIALKGDDEAKTQVALMKSRFDDAPRSIAQAAGETILDALKNHVPRETSTLAESLGFELFPEGTGWRVDFHGDYYVQWVIDGHGEIVPKIFTGRGRQPVLHFFTADGDEIFTTHVKAVRGNDFRGPAMEEARPELQFVLSEEGRKILGG